MENPEITEAPDLPLYLQPSEFNDEYDHYDETEDDYDFNEEDTYDDGIARTVQDDSWEEGYDDEIDEYLPETSLNTDEAELEDSLQESEDYDALDD